MSIPVLRLQPQEDRRLKAGHLWIYSNEVDNKATPLSNFSAGQLVRIESHRGQGLGIAYVNPRTLLCARLLTRNLQQNIDQTFFEQRILEALSLRQMIFNKPFYRLVFGESDNLPGLVVDRYGDILVVQITTAGMEQLKEIIIAALQNTLKPTAILFRNDSSIRVLEGLDTYVKPALDSPPDMVSLEENGVQFFAPIISGQKTGWFYDHRYNRARMRSYVKGKRVLDVFSYIGGWGIQAAVAGAEEVLCIDSSATALQHLQKNAELNQVEKIVHTEIGDAFDQLKKLQASNKKFAVIILDPPAFIKKRKDVKAGTAAYQKLNDIAVSLLEKNGILITASCSLHLPADVLLDIVRRAGINTKREIQILEQGHQAPDHPIHPAIAETAYLKALFCRAI